MVGERWRRVGRGRTMGCDVSLSGIDYQGLEHLLVAGYLERSRETVKLA